MLRNGKYSMEALLERLAQSDIRANRLMLLLRMAMAVRGGITPADFLRALADTEAYNGRSGHAKVYRLAEARLRSGEYATHEALENLTTSDDRCFLYAEEKVADLAMLLQMAYDTALKHKRIQDAILRPFVFPAYLLLICVGILLVGGTMMLPTFAPLMPMNEWEFPSRVVYHLGQALIVWWPLIIVCIGAVALWVMWSLPNLRTPLRTKYLDRVFPWSLYKNLQSSNFVLNMAAMFKAKVSILDAVNGYAVVSKPYSSYWAQRMAVRLESEQTTSDMRALDVGFIDQGTIDSMRILNSKLPADVVLETIGNAEFELLAEEVRISATRIAKGLTVVMGASLLFTLYGTMSVVPTFTEKMMNITQKQTRV